MTIMSGQLEDLSGQCVWIDCDKPVAISRVYKGKALYRKYCHKHHKVKYGRYNKSNNNVNGRYKDVKVSPVLSAKSLEEIKEVYKPVNNYRCGCARIDGKKLCPKHG